MIRALHVINGTLGELFKDFDEPITAPKGTNTIFIEDPRNGKLEVFDNFENRWVSATILESISPTFTFAPKPTNVYMELDYFLRGAGLPKHSYIWSTDSIPVDVFYSIRSDQNNFFRGRYTVTPWLPQIAKLGRIYEGFYETDDDDWELTFT